MNTAHHSAIEHARRKAQSEAEEEQRTTAFRTRLRLSTFARFLHAMGIDGAEPTSEQFIFDGITYTFRQDWEGVDATATHPQYPSVTFRSQQPIRTKEQLGAFLLTIPPRAEPAPEEPDEVASPEADAYYQCPIAATLMYY